MSYNIINKRLQIVFLVLSVVLCSSFQPINDAFKIKTIVIDAGHGGKDSGCLGKHSNEKNVALSISLKLGKYIEDNIPGVKVIYTRKTDVFLELYERAKIANEAKADLFICIHANASTSPHSHGTETYVMGLHKTESNLKVAQRENESILLEENYQTKYADFNPNSAESYIALTLRQNAFLEQSLIFAAKIQDQFEKRLGRFNRGVKQAGFLVLHQTAMPSVLIETGFLTNEEEEKFLDSEIGQDYIASAIYRAFKEYKRDIESKEIADTKGAIEEPEEQNNTGNVNTPSPDTGLVYKVQIATSSIKLEAKPENFNGLDGVEFYEAGGLYRYTYGASNNYDNVVKMQTKARDNGFKDAFVVAFVNGKRISLQDALKMAQKTE